MEREEEEIPETEIEDIESAFAKLSQILGEDVKRIELFSRLRRNEVLGASLMIVIGKMYDIEIMEKAGYKILETLVSTEGWGRKCVIELGKALGAYTEVTEGGIISRFKRLIKREV